MANVAVEKPIHLPTQSSVELEHRTSQIQPSEEVAVEDQYTKLKTLQRDLQFLEIQVFLI